MWFPFKSVVPARGVDGVEAAAVGGPGEYVALWSALALGIPAVLTALTALDRPSRLLFPHLPRDGAFG